MIVHRPQPHLDLIAVAAELDGIAQQIGKHLQDALAIAQHGDRRNLTLRRQPNALLLRQRLVNRNSLVDQLNGDLRLQAVDDHVQASVIDSGPGIASDDLPLVFDAYWSGAKNRRNGTGLGLYITKRIIEAHDGRIWIESEPGKGTAVHFTLALSKADATS